MEAARTLRQILRAYAHYRQATATPATTRNDRWCLRYFEAYLSHAPNADLRTTCLAFLAHLRTLPLQQGSIATIAQRVYHMLKWAVEEGYLDKMPLKPKELPKQPEPAPEPLSLDALQRLWATPLGRGWLQARNRALLLTLLETGCRVGELMQIRVADAQQGYADVIQKGGRPHRLLFTTPCLEAIRAYLEACPFALAPSDLLWRTHDNRPLDAKRLAFILAKWGNRVGIRLYPHRLRATSATLRLAAGAPTEVVRRALGHTTDEALRHYVKLADSQQRALLEATSPAARLLCESISGMTIDERASTRPFR